MSELPAPPDHSDHRVAIQSPPARNGSQRKSIDKARVIALLVAMVSVAWYHEFWWDVFETSLEFLAKARSQTVFSSCAVFLFWFVYRFIKSPIPISGFVRLLLKGLAIVWSTFLDCIVYGIAAFVLIMVFIAAPQVYLKKKTDLAKLSPGGSYEALANDLKKERDGRVKADANAEHYRKQGIEWLIASTNTSTVIPALDEAIEANKRDRDSARAAGTNFTTLLTLANLDSEQKRLQEKRTLESQSGARATYRAMLLYIASEYERIFIDQVSNRCGGKLDPFPQIPTEEWWRTADNKRTDFISTNCGARFGCSFQRRGDPTTLIEISGTKTNARAEFILGTGSSPDNPHFHSRFYLGNGVIHAAKDSPPSDPRSCIRDINYILELLSESQAQEF